MTKLVLVLGLQPFGDEAFYWMESQRLAWAYSDLPGLTAWLIALGGMAGGDGVWAMRWPFFALGLLIPWQVVWLSRCWFDAATSWLAGTLAVLLPLIGMLGVLALPDVALTTATLLCLHAAARLQQRTSTRALAQLGVGLVAGALCHYRFVVVIAALALGLALSGALPRLLRARGFWLALVVGALAWMPLLWFNLRHAGAGLAFQLLDRHPWRFQIEGLWQPPVQALLTSPLLYLVMLLAWWGSWRRWRELGSGPAGLQFGFAALPLLGFFVLGFFADDERVSFHWALPAYLPLLPLAAGVLVHRTVLRRMTLALAAICSALAVAFLAVAAVPDSPGPRDVMQKWFPANFTGWREIADRARGESESLPANGVIVADNFMLAAQLEFALRDVRAVYALDHPLNSKHGRALQLRLWQRDAQALAALPHGTPALFVVEQSATKASLRSAWQRRWCDQFESLQPLADLRLFAGQKHYLLYRARLGSQPPDRCARPALARLYGFPPGRSLSGVSELRGWAIKDGSGIDAVRLLLGGRVIGEARYGLPAAHVREAWPESDDPNHPGVGFAARIDPTDLAAGDYQLEIQVRSDRTWEVAESIAVRVGPDADAP